MIRCYTCIHWRWVGARKGNCNKHPWAEDKYADDATPGPVGCNDHVDKYAVASAKEG